MSLTFCDLDLVEYRKSGLAAASLQPSVYQPGLFYT